VRADLSTFQKVLEAVEAARTSGMNALVSVDVAAVSNDDLQCYPRGLILGIDSKDPRWASLRFLAKHLDWISLEASTKRLHIRPPVPITSAVTEAQYLVAAAEGLNERDIPCAPDIRYRTRPRVSQQLVSRSWRREFKS
jgi:hypothetical protein